MVSVAPITHGDDWGMVQMALFYPQRIPESVKHDDRDFLHPKDYANTRITYQTRLAHYSSRLPLLSMIYGDVLGS